MILGRGEVRRLCIIMTGDVEGMDYMSIKTSSSAISALRRKATKYASFDSYADCYLTGQD